MPINIIYTLLTIKCVVLCLLINMMIAFIASDDCRCPLIMADVVDVVIHKTKEQKNEKAIYYHFIRHLALICVSSYHLFNDNSQTLSTFSVSSILIYTFMWIRHTRQYTCLQAVYVYLSVCLPACQPTCLFLCLPYVPSFSYIHFHVYIYIYIYTQNLYSALFTL